MPLLHPKETSVFGVNKIIHAETVGRRCLWTCALLTLVALLGYCVGNAITAYAQEMTVFETSYLEKIDTRFPDVSVCVGYSNMSEAFEENMGQLMNITPLNKDFYPWFETVNYSQPLIELSNKTGIISYWANMSEFKVFTEVTIWDSRSAKSIYHRIFHNQFSVIIKSNARITKIRILEAIPVLSSFLCLTFQVFSDKLQTIDSLDVITIAKRPWVFEYSIVPPNHVYKADATFIISPRFTKQVYFTYHKKMSLSTAVKTACITDPGPLRIYDHYYDYTKTTCSFHREMERIREECNCTQRTVDVLNYIRNPCPLTCPHNILTHPNRDVFGTCREACNTIKVVVNAELLTSDDTPKSASMAASHRTQLTLIFSDPMEILREEIFVSKTRLWSEIGGLSSFFIGLSLSLFFEILESVILYWCHCEAEPSPVDPPPIIL